MDTDRALASGMPLRPVILSGGEGKRLWPLSTRERPKQFLTAFGARSLFQQTCRRFRGPPFRNPVVIGNREHRFLLAEQMRAAGLEPERIVLEPVARNTAPAALIASLLAAQDDENALILLLPSDHVVEHPGILESAVLAGAADALNGSIVLFGTPPESPWTGYGYIEVSANRGTVRRVNGFVEKPTAEIAANFLGTGKHLWNTGIFLFSARTMITAFQTHAREFIEPCRQALRQARCDLDFLHLEKSAYGGVPARSLDLAIMEQASNIACVPVDCGWRDIGSWPSFWEDLAKDERGNAAQGDVTLMETGNSLAISDRGRLAVVGLNDIVAVKVRETVMVAARDRLDEINPLIVQLATEHGNEVLQHNRVYRPWGWFEQLECGEGFCVKQLMIGPGEKLSLQSHRHRCEHWIVVSGSLEVTEADKTRRLDANQSAYIPRGTRHRLANTGKEPAMLIEIQTGSYLGEDDIVRYEDAYGRCAADGMPAAGK